MSATPEPIEHGFVIRRLTSGLYCTESDDMNANLQKAFLFPEEDETLLGEDEGFLPATRDAAGHITLEEGK
jgi:hypothetical protein